MNNFDSKPLDVSLEQSVIGEEVATEDKSRTSRIIDKLKNGARYTVIGLEFSPANEIGRFALLGASISSGASTPESALVFGGATLAIESASVVAATPSLVGDRANRVTEKIRQKIDDKSFVPDDNKFVWGAVKAGAAIGGGSVVSQVVKKVESPDIKKRELRDYGLKASVAIAGACAIQGAAIAEGVNHPDPSTIGVALVALAGTFSVGGWAIAKLKGKSKKSELEIIKQPDSIESIITEDR